MKQPSIARRVYFWALDTRRHYRYALTLFIGIILAYGLWSGLFDLVGSRLRYYNREIDQLQQHVRAHHAAQQGLRKSQAELAQLNDTLKNYQRRLTPNAHEHLLLVMDAAHSAGLALSNCGPVQERTKDWRTLRTIQTNGSGTLAQAVAFLTSLQKADVPMRVLSLSLNHERDARFGVSCTLEIVASIKNPST